MAGAENRNAQASRFQKESHDDGEKDPQELSAVFVDVIVDDDNCVPVRVASVCVRDVRDANVHCCKRGHCNVYACERCHANSHCAGISWLLF